MSENRERGTQADPSKDVRDAGVAKEKWGRGVSIVGIFLAVLGLVAAFFGTGASVVPGALGVMLGILGYFLGANRIGTITIVLCTAVIFFGLAASQDLIPGIDGNNRNMPTEGPVVG